jgi:hypothetical protein
MLWVAARRSNRGRFVDGCRGLVLDAEPIDWDAPRPREQLVGVLLEKTKWKTTTRGMVRRRQLTCPETVRGVVFGLEVRRVSSNLINDLGPDLRELSWSYCLGLFAQETVFGSIIQHLGISNRAQAASLFYQGLGYVTFRGGAPWRSLHHMPNSLSNSEYPHPHWYSVQGGANRGRNT